MVYHVRITLKGEYEDILSLDLTKYSLLKKIVNKYHDGKKFTVGGHVINPHKIEQIKINETEETSSQIIPQIKARRMKNKVIVPISDEWYVTKEGIDVTDKFIKNPPGRKNIDENLETKILEYINSTVEKDNIDIRNLSFNHLREHFKVDKKRLENVLGRLERGDLISEKESGIKIYIPSEAQLKPEVRKLKLRSPYYWVLYYFLGLGIIFILSKLIPSIETLILNYPRLTNSIDNIISIGFIWGFFCPIMIGLIINKAYQYLSSIIIDKTTFNKIKFNRAALLTIIFSMGVSLIIYILLTQYLGEQVNSTGISGFVFGGAVVGGLLWQFVFRGKDSADLNKKRGV
ncbi:MAG: hypothetical protein JW716_01835 [Candidatus Aenigmarchaeota archaeon]|nr:hypothetical protein [Candidatus Aenigmarchaeota archaeon]